MPYIGKRGKVSPDYVMDYLEDLRSKVEGAGIELQGAFGTLAGLKDAAVGRQNFLKDSEIEIMLTLADNAEGVVGALADMANRAFDKVNEIAIDRRS